VLRELAGDRRPIRVLLVDDSPLALALLQRALATSPDIEVVGTARSGPEALELIPQLQPTVICTDYVMPGMDGRELIQHVMARHPRPILVVSSTVDPEHTERAFPLLEAGAVDVCPKPRGGSAASAEEIEQLITKIRLVSGVFVFPKRAPSVGEAALGAWRSAPGPTKAGPVLTRPSAKRQAPSAGAKRPPSRIVAIGASTGGPQALQSILSRLPAELPVPLLCVQHISPGFLKGLVEWLAGQCRIHVRIARDGETPAAGTAYFPQEQTHLVLGPDGRLQLTHDPPVAGHRPSVTVTLESVARHYGSAALGVLLTGMGEDGVTGMRAIAGAGGATIAQDEATSVVFGMPKQAIAVGAAEQVLPPAAIAQAILKAVTT
jgi:two-component system, chemotaxis family, protein-glutamate methylesterase/glutaminase